MKRVFVLITVVALFATAIPVKAGGVYEGPEPGTSILGVRMGADLGFMNVNAVYDYSLAKVWKGAFTIGAFGGFGFGLWGNRSGDDWFYSPIMARTTYRFSVVVPQWEVYAGVMLGVCLYFHDGVFPGFAGGMPIGTSYYFTDKFGVNFEFNCGYGTSYANLGVKFKF